MPLFNFCLNFKTTKRKQTNKQKTTAKRRYGVTVTSYGIRHMEHSRPVIETLTYFLVKLGKMIQQKNKLTNRDKY